MSMESSDHLTEYLAIGSPQASGVFNVENTSGLSNSPYALRVDKALRLGENIEARFKDTLETVLDTMIKMYTKHGKSFLSKDELFPLVCAILAKMEIQKGDLLTDDFRESEVAYLAHFSAQHISEGREAGYDCPQQVFYPRIQGQEALVLGRKREIIQNYDVLLEELDHLREALKESLETGALMVVSNHISWANLGILVPLLQDLTDLSLDRISTVLGPAVTMFPQAMGSIQRISNVHKTWPMTDFARIGDNHFKKGLISVGRGFQSSFGDQHMTEAGNAGVLAPSGTRDTWINSRQVLLNTPGRGSLDMIHTWSEQGRILVLGINEAAVFDPKTMQSKPGPVFASGELFQPGDFKASDGNAIMQALARHVKDSEGVIGVYHPTFAESSSRVA